MSRLLPNDIPVYMDRLSLPIVRDLMLGKIGVGNEPAETYSLAHKLGLLGLDGWLPIPDAIAFTINTAVPVADAVRGAFDAADVEVPHLFGIHANHLYSSLEKISRKAAPEVDVEIERLAELRQGRTNVVVIDEYRYSGGSLNLAVKMLHEAGYQTCTPIAGMWYQNIRANELFLDEMSSAYAPQMQKIGRLCYEAFLGSNATQTASV